MMHAERAAYTLALHHGEAKAGKRGRNRKVDESVKQSPNYE